ncbi:ATP-dependent DNA helicase Q1-like [Phlebotomus argentipes]|uniref:ATP-dependent DNA helicase Q1-like n=1 Tax=Phlebotomus argentipes TaxID=94469 RepID=UPI002892F7D3|nr:ATP-dependent DNA helicase Q1-like [Phlebotomus argentipes]
MASSPSSSTALSASEEISQIDQKIKEIDVEIFRLRRQRQQLEAKKEKLKEISFAEKSRALSKQNWTGDFPWTADIRKHLKQTFGFEEFKEYQLRAINAIMSGHDMILVSPTGGGKSLCYQLPACVGSGLTLVVSPLIALMENQKWALEKLGVGVEVLTQGVDRTTTQRILKQLANPAVELTFRILYVAPERLSKSKRLMSCLQKCYFAKRLDRIAIDEVHCCSTWGHDFRPDYKFLGSLKTTFPDVPILGVTATATEKVINDVQKMLNIRDGIVLKVPFNRPNLYYQIMEKPAERKGVVELLVGLLKRRYAGKSGIIYTLSQKDTEQLATALIQHNCQVSPYHANLDAEVRSRVHENWLTGQIQAVVATVAFGMGIDKPDVRFVIHHTISRSLENFHQESGRAGRDGEYAECVVLYRLTDVFKITTMMFAEKTGLENAYAMVQFCITGAKCRRTVLAENLSEDVVNCRKMCDRCLFRKRMSAPPKVNVTKHLKLLLEILDKADSMDMKLTGAKLIEAWFNKGPACLRANKKKAPAFDRTLAEHIIAHLILEEYLKEDFHYTAYSTNSYIKKGPRALGEDAIVAVNRVRFLDLPDDFPRNEHQSDDDVVLVSPSKRSPEKRHRRESGCSSSPQKRAKMHRHSASAESIEQMEIESDDESDGEAVEVVHEMPSHFIDLDDSLFDD